MAASTYLAGESVTEACPWTSSAETTSSPNCARRRSAISAGDSRLRDPGTPLLLDVFLADLLLELQDPMKQAFGAGRASGHVDVHRHDLVHAPGDRVGVPGGPTAVGASPERNDVL